MSTSLASPVMRGRLLWLVFVGAACKAQLIGGASSTSSSSGPTSTTRSAQPGTDDRVSGAGTAQTITLPDTMGMTRSEAEAALRAAGVGGEIRVNDDGNSADPAMAKVCLQSPGGGQQSRTSLGVTLSMCGEPKPYVEQRTELVGYSVEEATRRARSAGYTGNVDVRSCTTCGPSCKLDTVCRVSPDRWELNQEMLILFVARAATITLPD